MSKVKCKLCHDMEETTKFLNELKDNGHNLSMNLLSITQDKTFYTVFYNDVFDGRGNGNL